METKRKRKIHQYTQESLQQAIQEIADGGKIRAVCKRYGVPRATIQDRLHGRVPMKPRQMGPDPVLTIENEAKIVNWIMELTKCGFPLKKQELLSTVQKIVKDGKIIVPFKDGRPGQTWYSGFLRRHPEITTRTAEIIDKSRSKVTEEFIRAWFHDLNEFLITVNATEILNNPSRILNADETGFNLCPKTGKVLGLKGWKNVYQVTQGNPKENLTVLVTFTADGRLCPPVVVFPYVKPPRAVVESMPNSWILGKSDTGWMKSDVFFEFVANGLNDYLNEQQIERPVLFLVDGHKSHMSLELSEFCDKNKIILYALPPNTTHLLQPADVSVFRPLKEYWRQSVRKWQNENMNCVVTKTEFCPIFEQALKNPNMGKNIRKGFERCGLYPWNPNAVDYTKCVQNKLEQVNQSREQISELMPNDISSTIKVLNIIKPTCTDRNIDIDQIMDLVISLKSQLLESKTLNADLSMRDATLEDVGIPVEYELVNDNTSNDNPEGVVTTLEYQLTDDGSLRLVDEVVKSVIILENELLVPASNVSSKSLSPTAVESQSSVNLELENLFENPERLFDSENPNEVQNNCSVVKSANAVPIESPLEQKKCLRSEIGFEKAAPANVDVAKETHTEASISSPDISTCVRETPPNNSSTKEATTSTSVLIDRLCEWEKELDKVNLERDEVEKSFSVIEDSSQVTFETEKQPAESEGSTSITENLEGTTSTNEQLTTSEPFSPFKKHLQFPRPIDKSKKISKARLPSAISSEAWRNHYSKKAVEKEDKENAKKRRREEIEKKRAEKITNVTKRKKILKPVEFNKVFREKCGACTEELFSDAEEDSERNVGRDFCPSWFHLRCTKFLGRSYIDVIDEMFKCDICDS